MTTSGEDRTILNDPGAIHQRMAEIGRRLRQVRMSLRMSLSHVARETGLTKGFLSQLERGETSVSIANLLRISKVLGIEPSRLFDVHAASDRPLIRLDDRAIGFLNGDGVMEYQLTPSTERRFEVCEAHMAPMSSYGSDLYSVDVDIGFAYVLRGEVQVCFADRTQQLWQGDALTFSPREPHTFRNPSGVSEAVLLFLKSPALI